MKRIAALLLTVLMCLSCMLVSCGPTDPADTTTTGEAPVTTTGPSSANPAIVAIAGDYDLDATPHGMPLSFYVRINADGTFNISSKRDFSNDKGNGVVTESNGTFVLVYSDGTTTAPKTATFTVVDGNLVFSTRVPVGSAGIDQTNPDIPLAAYSLAHEELLGEYVGTYEKQSMMGTTLYEYSLVLTTGRRYTFTSSFDAVVEGEPTTFTLVETGVFTLDGTTFTITPKTQTNMAGEVTDVTIDPIAGTLVDGVITSSFKHSFMASSRAECTAQKATTAEIAGFYSAQKTIAAGPMAGTVTVVQMLIDKVGGYVYLSMVGENGYAEKGTVTFTATEVVLTKTHDLNPENGEEIGAATEAKTTTLTRGALSLSGNAPTAGMPTAVTLYHDSIQGPFAASLTAEEATDGIAREVILILDADATFEIQVMANDEVVHTIAGTFTVTKGMGVSLNLTLADESATLVGMVSDGMINVQNVPVDGNGTEISFGFSR